MHRGHCSMEGIGNQNGKAIGGSDSEGDPGLIRDQGIAFTDDAGVIGIHDCVRMHLPKRCCF